MDVGNAFTNSDDCFVNMASAELLEYAVPSLEDIVLHSLRRSNLQPVLRRKVGSFQKSRALAKTPNSRALIVRTPQ